MTAIHDPRVDKALTYLWEDELYQCSQNPVRWAKFHVNTKDEHDPDNPVKNFPDKDYLWYILEQWHWGENIQFVVKSRQLAMSWLLCVYACWTARFRPHSLVLFQSKKFEDAAKMVFLKWPNTARCSFIENNLPHWQKFCRDDKGNWLPIDLATACTEGAISYPNGSRIEAIPEGPQQIEGRVPTLFLNDEASLQDEWRAGHSASLPCLVGGTKKGRGITVSTIRMPSDYSQEVEDCALADPDSIMRGLGSFRSKSGVLTLRVHYSADPEKDPATEAGKEWLVHASQGYLGGIGSNEWQSHMEINPQSTSGERVLPMFNHIKDRVVIDDIPAEVWGQWSLDSGLDYGARNPTVWLVFANDYEGNRYLVNEISIPTNETGGIAGFCKLMKEVPHFERLNGKIHADPSIWNTDQNTSSGLVSKAQIFAQHGVYLVPAQTKGKEADDILLNRLNGYYWSDWESDDFEPRFFICRSAKQTIRAWPLMLWQDWQEALKQHRSAKEKMVDNWVDQWDAAKYAEVARPQPAYAKPAAPVGSFRYLQKLIQKQANATRYARS